MVSERFIKYTTVCNALAQNSSFSPKCWRIVVTLSWIVWLIHSATPFCMGVYGTVFWCAIPFSNRYCLKAAEVYSAPLSYRRVFITPYFRRVRTCSRHHLGASFLDLVGHLHCAPTRLALHVHGAYLPPCTTFCCRCACSSNLRDKPGPSRFPRCSPRWRLRSHICP